MKSTGNDIVALQFTDRQRTAQSTFYSKFITVAEQALYPTANLSFNDFVWLLWSVKESTYKYLKRSNAELVFSPSKIVIQHIDLSIDNPLTQFDCGEVGVFYHGSVQCLNQTLYFLSKITPQFIATVVNIEPDFASVYWGVKQIAANDTESQSKAVREFALDKLNQLLPGITLQITKTVGDYPVIIGNSKEIALPLSFAHHGNYVSYSFNAYSQF